MKKFIIVVMLTLLSLFSCTEKSKSVNDEAFSSSDADADGVEDNFDDAVDVEDINDSGDIVDDEVSDIDVDEYIDVCAGIECSGKGNCVVEDGKPVCDCTENGYEQSSSGTECVDIDECEKGTHNCGQAQCYNLEGSFECIQCMSLMTCRKVAGAVNGAVLSMMNSDNYLYALSSYHYDVFEITETDGLVQVAGDIVDGIPMYVKDGLLFVLNEKKQELFIYSTEDSLHFVKAGSVSMGAVMNIYLDNAMLYVIGLENAHDSGSGYYIFDITDPADPVKKEKYVFENTNPNKSIVKNGYAFISTDDRLIILNVSDPMDPVDVTDESLDKTGSWGMDINGDYLYLAGNYEGGMGNNEYFLKTMDITDPLNPVEIGFLALGSFPEYIKVSEKYAVVRSDLSTTIYDISNPEVYVNFAEVPGTDFLKAVHIKGETVFLAYPGIIKSADMSGELPLDPEIHFNSMSKIVDFHFEGKTLYLTEEFKTLSVYDVTDPYAPQFVNALEFNGREATALSFNNNTVYIGFKKGYSNESPFIESFDVSDPQNIISNERIEVEWKPLDMAVSNDLLYVAYSAGSSDFGFKIYDISDPASMQFKSQLNFYQAGKPPESYGNILVEGDFVYFAGFKFYIADIKDPEAPVLKARYNLFQGSLDMFFDDGVVYSVMADSGLEIIDVSDKEHPAHLLGGVKTPYIHLTGVWKKDSIVIASGYRGAYVFDVTDPQTQVYLGFFDAQNVGFEHIYLDDEFIYLMGDGLRILKQENIATCAINN